LDCPNRKVIALAEYQSLKQAKWEEDRDDKEVHLMEVEEECVEEGDEGKLLVLGKDLS